MFACDDYGGVISEAAGQIMQMNEQTRGNVLAGTRTHLNFLTEPTLWNVLETSSDPARTFQLEELRDQHQGITVYLCLPVDMMPVQGRWMRLVMMQIMRFIERTEFDKTRDRPLLMMIDEFFQLGRMPSIVNSLTYAPGFGLPALADRPGYRADQSPVPERVDHDCRGVRDSAVFWGK